MTQAEEPEVEVEEEAPSGPRHDMIKKEAEEMMKGMFSEEVKQHMIKAGSEFLLGIEAMMPSSRLSEETRGHYSKMRKEFLLLAKSIIDSRLELCEGKEASKGFKKIELE